jgi:hypothetical protein
LERNGKEKRCIIQECSRGCLRWIPLVNQPRHATNGSASENGRSRDGGLKPFGVAHGIGRREVKVVGDHHSASISQNDVMWLMETVVTCG